MAAPDIFQCIEDLFAGRIPEKFPYPFILHRFLASDIDYCVAAKEIQHATTDPALVFGIWQLAVPRGPAPRVKYVGPKKSPAAEVLVARLMEVEKINRQDAEEAVQLLTMMDKVESACWEYGIDPEKAGK